MYGTFTLTGRHTTPSGVAHKGQVVITPNTVIRDTEGNVVMSGGEKVVLDETGAWSIVLPCDSAGLNPAEGIGYRVGYALHSTAMLPVSFYATSSMAGSTLDVSDIVSVSVPTPLSAIVGPPAPDATADVAGKVRLAGDLGGTADAPTVPALASKVETTDPRLSDARTPLAHQHAIDNVAGLTDELSNFLLQGDADPVVAAAITGSGTQISTALDRWIVSRQRPIDPTSPAYGAVGDGVTDDTAAIQAALNDGDLHLPRRTFKVDGTIAIPSCREIVGCGAKVSGFTKSNDAPMFAWAGGEGQAVRNVRLESTYAGDHTSFLVDVANPTRPIFQYVEVVFPPESTSGGVRLQKDAGQAGVNSFMPSLDGVWIRNGRLVVSGVTDGFMSNSWVWAHNTSGAASIDLSAVSDGWTFSNVQVVPCDGTGSGYLFTNTNHTKIVGGYMDGSYDSVSTGYGIRAVNSGRIYISGYNFFNVGRSPIRLDNTHGCSVAATGFYRNNKSDGGYPDIDLYGSTGNVFLGTSHCQPRNQTNKGVVYREDAASTKNNLGNATLDTSIGNFYGTPYFSGNSTTRGANCKPESLWTRHPSAANLIAPPAASVSIPAPVAWPAANTAIAHRFQISVGAVYSLGNFRVDAGSGNMQVAVVKLTTATAYTRVLDSGIVACATGDKTLSLGAAYLDPGEYALVLWCDNATATFRYATNSGLTASRLTAEWVSASGVAASGTLAWGSAKYVGGFTLGN